MLKAAASCVLASRKASTCKSTPQPCAPQRSCCTATLNILVRARLYRKRFGKYHAGYSRKSIWLIAKARPLILFLPYAINHKLFGLRP